MSFKDLTPEQRKEASGKRTRNAPREGRQAQSLESVGAAFWTARPVEAELVAAQAQDYEDTLLTKEAAAPPEENDARAERRERLTGDLPADLAALITDDELEKIEREETDKALASKKKQALSDVRALASAEARIEHGLIPADVLRTEAEKARLSEKIKIRVNLPRGGGGLGLRIDGRLFRHAHIYTVTRAEYESMHYTVYKTWLDEIRFRTLDQNERGRSAIDQMTGNPPQLEVLA